MIQNNRRILILIKLQKKRSRLAEKNETKSRKRDRARYQSKSTFLNFLGSHISQANGKHSSDIWIAPVKKSHSATQTQSFSAAWKLSLLLNTISIKTFLLRFVKEYNCKLSFQQANCKEYCALNQKRAFKKKAQQTRKTIWQVQTGFCALRAFTLKT